MTHTTSTVHMDQMIGRTLRTMHTSELGPADRIRDAKLNMVRLVRTDLTEMIERLGSDGHSFELADMALDTPIETMMGWVLPNESLMSNVNTVLAMVRQTNNPTDPFAGIPGAADDSETW